MAQEKIIELQGVSIYHSREPYLDFNKRRSYRGGERVLSEVTLGVAPGELVFLVGKVGSGKSTLLKTLYAEIPLVEGEGRVAGFDLATLRRRDIPALRRQLGIVFQDYQLLGDRSVYDNLRFVMRATGWKDEAQIEEAIEGILAVVGLSSKEHKMPFELSGGEQQRLAIGRALINKPKVILADEPTGNLDPLAAGEIMQLFRRIASDGCAVVMSTHNTRNIQQCPARIVRFLGGRVEELDPKTVFGRNADGESA